jgi:hypothetical protein
MEDEEKPRRKAAWGWLSLAKAILIHTHQLGARQQRLLKLYDAIILCSVFGVPYRIMFGVTWRREQK